MDAVMNSSSKRGVTDDGSRVAQQVEMAIQQCGYRDLFGLEIECEAGTVTIHGHVAKFYLKQVAQAVVARVPGVLRIENKIIVS